MEDSHKELELSAKPFIIQKIRQVQLYSNKFKKKILVHYYIMNNLMTIHSTHIYYLLSRTLVCFGYNQMSNHSLT
jgi:hypothetical protein